MMPGTRKSRVALHLGMTGGRIPRHVGTWAVEDVHPAIRPDGTVDAVFTLRHERLCRCGRMLVGSQYDVIYAKMPDGWQCQLEQKGWKF